MAFFALPRRTLFSLLLGGCLVVGGLASVPPTLAGETPRVVILTPLPYDILDQSIAGIKDALAADGVKVMVTEVNANGQMPMLGAFAREILAGRPAVVVPVSTPATAAVVGAAAANQAIVYSTVTDPGRANVQGTAPNITGVSDVVDYRANIDLLRELLPNAKRVGTIYNPGDPAAAFGLEKIRPLFQDKGIDLVVVAAANSNEVINAASLLTGEDNKVDAIYIGSDGTAAAAMPGLVAIARKAAVPIIASDAGSVRNGALAAVSVDYRKLGLACGRLVADILRTGKPAGAFTRINFIGDTLIVNASTAKALGYTFPPAVLARGPQVVGAPAAP